MAPALVATTRLLADHGQFFAYDASVDPYESFPVITEDITRRGWARTDRAIYYFTFGQLWDFRLDLFRDTQPPVLDAAERVIGHTLHLSTGRLAVGNPVADGNVSTIDLAPGSHSLFLRAFHFGVEADAHMDDEAFLRRSDLERYELFVVPGGLAEEGVLLGRQMLW
jgi:hypothetical protein